MCSHINGAGVCRHGRELLQEDLAREEPHAAVVVPQHDGIGALVDVTSPKEYIIRVFKVVEDRVGVFVRRHGGHPCLEAGVEVERLVDDLGRREGAETHGAA